MATSVPDIAPYSSLHQNIRGPGDQRPTAIQVVQSQGLVGKLGHLNILVTGGNSGLGKEAVRAFHVAGARVIITVAPGVDGAKAVAEIEQLNKSDSDLSKLNIPYKPIESVSIDLGSLGNVKSVAAHIKEMTGDSLNVLVCNAGVMEPSFEATTDGFEPHFGINYLGHFLLFNELTSSLSRASRVPSVGGSRVVVMSSLGHRASNVDVDLLPPKVGEKGHNLYCDSKTEILWMANEINRRFQQAGIHGLAVNPGSIATPLTAHVGWDGMRQRMGKDVDEFDRLTKNVEQGAATAVWAAIGRELEGIGGYYLDDIQIAVAAVEGAPAFTHGFESWAYDDHKASQLWTLGTALLEEKGFEVALES